MPQFPYFWERMLLRAIPINISQYFKRSFIWKLADHKRRLRVLLPTWLAIFWTWWTGTVNAFSTSASMPEVFEEMSCRCLLACNDDCSSADNLASHPRFWYLLYMRTKEFSHARPTHQWAYAWYQEKWKELRISKLEQRLRQTTFHATTYRRGGLTHQSLACRNQPKYCTIR